MNNELKNYLTKNGLFSFMNNTKWKKIIHEINSKDGYEPQVNIEYVMNHKNWKELYSKVWWNEVEKEGFEYIKVLRINPIEKIHRGKLIEDKIMDHSEFITQSLKKHNVSIEKIDGIFLVYGYK